jgi:hypothetical protein
MIICEECGARNRNGAYVCAECGASLLHLDATGDDEAVPVKRKAPVFGRKAHMQADEEPEYQYEESTPEADETLVYEEPEEVEEAPIRPRKPLFGRRGRRPIEKEEPEFEEENAPEADEAEPDTMVYEEPEEEEDVPVRRRMPLFGRRTRRAAEEQQEYEYEETDSGEAFEGRTPEPVSSKYEDIAPVQELRFKYEDPEYTEETGIEPEEVPELEQPGIEPEADIKVGVSDESEEVLLETGEPEAVTAKEPGSTIKTGEPVPDEASQLEEEIPADSIEIAEPVQDAIQQPVYGKARPYQNQQTVHVHVARAKVDKSKAYEDRVPSSISINMDADEYEDELDDEPQEREGMTRGMIAAIITVASLLVVTMVVLGVLLIGKNQSTPVIATSAPAPVTATVAPATPGPTPTPVPTTNAEDDYSSVFEQPTDNLISGAE